MIGSDIEQGEVYAWARSKFDPPRRCIVVDREEIYDGDRPDWFNGKSEPMHRVWRVGPTRRRSRKFGVAIEYKLRDSTWNEKTNEWDRVDLGTVWVPFAARSAEILRPWPEQEAINADKESARRRQAEVIRRNEERSLRRNEILRAFDDAGSKWRSDWHRLRDRRLEAEGRRALIEQIGEMVQAAIDDRRTYPSGETVADEIVNLLIEEYGIDVTKPLPDPIAALQGRAS